MDLLLKRYASPFLMYEAFDAGELEEFVDGFMNILNEEKTENTLWEFYLHKIYEISYEEFLNNNKKVKQDEKPVDFETAIIESMNIIEGFIPD